MCVCLRGGAGGGGGEGCHLTKGQHHTLRWSFPKGSGRGWVHPSPGMWEIFGCRWVPPQVPAEAKQAIYQGRIIMTRLAGLFIHLVVCLIVYSYFC